MMFAVVLWGVLGCVRGESMPRPEPEICGDGIDNNNDGLTDCEDEATCGGIQCREGQGPDTGDSTKPVEIVIDETRCCDFTFNDQNCSGRPAGRIDVVNRTDEEGSITLFRCDSKDFGDPVGFSADGAPSQELLANIVLEPMSTVTVEPIFDCATNMPFTAMCEASAEAGPFRDDRGFVVRGTIGN